jgi:dCMP deaminase
MADGKGETQAASTRVSWDEYFMNIATVVASRSTCPRKYVGAVIVREKTILSTGYNGSIRGMPHCSDVGHMMENDHCVATIHAESNAILQAAKNGVMIDGATVYVTASPCWNCFKQIANAGIRRIVYGEFYRDERIFSVSERLGIELLHLPPTVKPGPTAPAVPPNP